MRGPAGTAALGLAMLGAAGVFDAEPLLAGGVALAVLAPLLGLWVLAAARGITVERRLAATRVQEEEPLDVRVRVSSRLPLPGGRVEEPLLERPVALGMGRRSADVRIHVRFARRGRRILDPSTVEVRDPLGLARRRLDGGRPAEVLVLPRTEPVQMTATRAGRLGLSAGNRRRPGSDGIDPDGLAPYRPGAPAARIHWPALARGSGLLERRLAPDASARPLIVLDASGAARERDVDRAVRAAASLCRHLARDGGCSILLPGERRPRRVEDEGRSFAQAWAALAQAPARRPAGVAGAVARAEAVILVTARSPARPPAWLSRCAGSAVLVSSAGSRPLPRARVVLEVAGCRGQVLGAAARRAA